MKIQDTIQVAIFATAVAAVLISIAFFMYKGSLHDNASQCIENGKSWVVSEKDDGDGSNTQYECR